MSKLENGIALLRLWDLTLCVRFNRTARIAAIRHLFRVTSRLGDGAFWYALMLALLAAEGGQALRPVGHMAAIGFVCTVIYKWLKSKTSRPRPFAVESAVRAGTEPLDAFSFPSGHTLHAVAFSTIAIAYYPALTGPLVLFSALVALSRVVLGLHYPSDVLAGGALGGIIAEISFCI